MYFLLQLVLIIWSVYAVIIGKLSQYQLIIIVFLSLVVELLVALNRKFETAEINYEDDNKEEKK